jgi:hydrogenase nickel incorporation protein HypA/HybF
MHEMAIATQLMQQLEQLAAEHDISRIESLTVRAGVMRGVVPEALELAFASIAEGTFAEGAEVVVDFEPAEARCRICGRQFEPAIDDYLCRHCGEADIELIAGNDIVLADITAQQHEGVNHP